MVNVEDVTLFDGEVIRKKDMVEVVTSSETLKGRVLYINTSCNRTTRETILGIEIDISIEYETKKKQIAYGDIKKITKL